MGSRESLSIKLRAALGSTNVYFQPPSTITMKYPCIVYEKSDIDTKSANDGTYLARKQYKITVIDTNPDSLIPDRIANLPMCRFITHYTASNLNHDVYNIYY